MPEEIEDEFVEDNSDQQLQPQWNEYYDSYYRRHPDPDEQLERLRDGIRLQDLYDSLDQAEEEKAA
jgi:hypothetical protein